MANGCTTRTCEHALVQYNDIVIARNEKLYVSYQHEDQVSFLSSAICSSFFVENVERKLFRCNPAEFQVRALCVGIIKHVM